MCGLAVSPSDQLLKGGQVRTNALFRRVWTPTVDELGFVQTEKNRKPPKLLGYFLLPTVPTACVRHYYESASQNNIPTSRLDQVVGDSPEFHDASAELLNCDQVIQVAHKKALITQHKSSPQFAPAQQLQSDYSTQHLLPFPSNYYIIPTHSGRATAIRDALS